MSKSRDTHARWRGIIARQQASGASVATFCRRARVPQSSFFAWRRKLRHAVTFAEVQVASTPAPPELPRAADALEVRLPGGRSIVVRPGFDGHTLRDLLTALEAGA